MNFKGNSDGPSFFKDFDSFQSWLFQAILMRKRSFAFMFAHFGPRVCIRLFPNGGSSFVGERNSAAPFLPHFYVSFTSVLPQYCLFLTPFLMRCAKGILGCTGISLLRWEKESETPSCDGEKRVSDPFSHRKRENPYIPKSP